MPVCNGRTDGLKKHVIRPLMCVVAACDIEATRELARVTPMPGGWQAEDTSSEIITQLYNRAVRIAAVRRGVVRDAFYQVKPLPFVFITSAKEVM